jgi:hypothetical protein
VDDGVCAVLRGWGAGHRKSAPDFSFLAIDGSTALRFSQTGRAEGVSEAYEKS